MKVEYLRKIIEAKLILEDYYGNKKNIFGSALRTLEEKLVDGEYVPRPEEEWFPKIEGLKEEFEILKREVRDTIAKKNEAKQFLYNEYKCEHPVKISNYVRGLHSYEDTCILCGKSFWNSIINKSNDMVSLNDKNKKTAIFIGEESVIQDGFIFGAEEEYIINYTQEEIIKIILDILDKNESEDIDIVEEIRKLNLNKCVINTPHNKNLILIIIGSNKQYLDKYTYFANRNFIDSQEIIKYFRDLYNTAIEIVGDKESLKKYEEKEDTLILTECDTIQDLERHLKYEEDIPFSLIIDMSSLFTYTIVEDKIKPIRYQVDLKKIFLDIPIINIEDLSKDNLEDLKKFLENDSSITYACQYNTYYNMQNNELRKLNASNMCNNIKKLIKK